VTRLTLLRLPVLVGALIVLAPACTATSTADDGVAATVLAAELTVVVTAPPTTVAPTTTTTTTTSTTSTTTTTTIPPSVEASLELVETITGDISPKSVVWSGDDLFFAQNMMYRHTVTVYDRSFELVATIADAVAGAALGLAEDDEFRGAPVEAAFTSDGRYAYVSNYQMYGPGFANAGGDECGLDGWDDSFLYRIATDTLEIDQTIAVGAVPKFVAVTPNDSLALVTNWCSFDMSVVDTAVGSEIGRVPLGRHPRGIAVTGDSAVAYVAVMGGRDIAVVSLQDLSVDWIRDVGSNPRHLVIDPGGVFLYATLNGSGQVIKINLVTRQVVDSVVTGAAPRSMAISEDGLSLYVVNYNSDSVSKVSTADFEVLQELPTDHHPIGITYDAETRSVWVSNYSGSIQVFQDRQPGDE